MPSTYMYDGSAHRWPMTEIHQYDGTAWRDLNELWSYDGSVWRKIFEKTAACSCTGVSIDSFNESDDATGCTCAGKINQQYVTVFWTHTGGDRDCHHVRVERSSNGSSWTSYATDLEPGSATNGCSAGAYDGCYKTPSCVTHQYYWRVKMELDSDNTVCSTSSSQQANNCLV